jgi:hypothetical protein
LKPAGLLDLIQGGLDYAGFIPGAGAVPDALNALISLGRGDFQQAGSNAFATIPFVGDAAKGTQMAVKAVKAVDKANDAKRAADKINDARTAAQKFSKEKQALVDMAKKDKHKGMTKADMEAYKDLNRELPDPFPANKVRGPEAHPSRGPHSQQPHGHVGPVDHITIRD